jgi:HEAT repeat protein
MKISRQATYLVSLFFLITSLSHAQEQRTVKTQVADILAKLPANDNAEGEKIARELVTLGEEGLRMIAKGVAPSGVDEGIPYRYAISLLTHYGKLTADKAMIEKVYVEALTATDNDEVKAYFLNNLELVGSDSSVPVIGGFLTDKNLAFPAAGALETIGTKDALRTLASALAGSAPATQQRILKSLALKEFKPGLGAISNLISSPDSEVKKHALRALAMIADNSSTEVLLGEAQKSGFKTDPTEATLSLLAFAEKIRTSNPESVRMIAKEILGGTLDESQQHLRLAALKLSFDGSVQSANMLIQELGRFDPQYRREILKHASQSTNADYATRWNTEYKKATGELQGELLTLLSSVNNNKAFVQSTLLPALSSKNIQVRIAAATAIGKTREKAMTSPVVTYLLRSSDSLEIHTAKTALLLLTDKTNVSTIAAALPQASPRHQVILLDILKERRATDQFNAVSAMANSRDTAVSRAAYVALANVSTGKNVGQLLSLLEREKNSPVLLQNAIVSSIDAESSPLILEAYEKSKLKLLPVLPYVKDKSALTKVERAFFEGSNEEKSVAFTALSNWQNHEAARTLLRIRRDASLTEYHPRALAAFINQVSRSSWPDEQKLLMLREGMNLASTDREKISIIRAAGSLRTFLALVFVSGYLEDAKLSSAASRAAMQIALPTSDAKPGLTGSAVRTILQGMLDKLTGNDSQYERIDIQTYLDQMPYTKGFEPIFNGKDLSGWQGLVDDPIKRSKMSKEELARRQAEANNKLKESWSVKDGAIWFSGEGGNLCTVKPYGDFEMVVDWKISRHGDSGIYLRGSPQVQIWDTSRADVGAQVGSGGLYNNQKNRSTPLVVADNPVGEWNTFNIRMVGDKVTVHLNGVLVVDNVVMENYWDRSLPIFPQEAIELQAHGTELAFRNIYVKELNSKPAELTSEEKQEGFELLFNGKDLSNWVGNKKDYVVEDNTIAIYPSKDSHGNLSTEKEFSDFIFRFEFQLTPGANNGLGIHAPLEGDAAYVGKEIQILDNTAAVYAKLGPWQYHGSVYGVMAAKRDFLKPVGEWNQEEVYVKGSFIRVTLNGTVIVEGDMKKASKGGTLDKKEHPGLNRQKGHISFLGHGSVVKFRNIRIKEMK